MKKPLPTCCTDMDIALEHLIFPERMSEEGQEFVTVHGLDTKQLKTLRKDAQDMGDGIVKIKHRCKMLLDNGQCKIYNNRPLICRTFDCGTREDCACDGSGCINHDEQYCQVL